MNEVVEIKILENYHIWIKFRDGLEKIVDLKPFIGKGIFKELLEKEYFYKVFIEPGGGIAWYNGFDICPNFLREL